MISCTVLCDEAWIILKGIRLRGVRLLEILSYCWHVGSAGLLLICSGLGVFGLNRLETEAGNILSALIIVLDIAMGVYMVIVMSLTFVLNDSVPRSLPRAHLRVMWCLTFFIAFLTMVKILSSVDVVTIWWQMDLRGRYRASYAIMAIAGLFTSIIAPAVFAGSIILLTRITQTSEKPERSSAASMSMPLHC